MMLYRRQPSKEAMEPATRLVSSSCPHYSSYSEQVTRGYDAVPCERSIASFWPWLRLGLLECKTARGGQALKKHRLAWGLDSRARGACCPNTKRRGRGQQLRYVRSNRKNETIEKDAETQEHKSCNGNFISFLPNSFVVPAVCMATTTATVSVLGGRPR